MAYTYDDYKKMYAEKKRTLQQCLDMIQSGDHICFGKDCNEPLLFCQQLHTVAPRVEGVTVLKGRSSDFGFLQNEGIKGHILTQSAFFSKGWQCPLELGNCTFCSKRSSGPTFLVQRRKSTQYLYCRSNSHG